MYKLGQKGASQLLIVALIVGGVVLGTFLIGQQTNLFPQAKKNEEKIKPEVIKTPFPEAAMKCLEDTDCDEGWYCKTKELGVVDDATEAARRDYGKCLRVGDQGDEQEEDEEGNDKVKSPKPSKSPNENSDGDD